MRELLMPTDKAGDNVHPSLMREPGKRRDGLRMVLSRPETNASR